MYKPNFCAECGTKVLRLRWHLWTSRKFCNACARKFRKSRVAGPLLVSLALITSGYLAGRSRRPPPPPLTIVRRAESPLSDAPASRASALAPAAMQSGSGVTGTPEPGSTAEEDVYLCGARTKKGTPCSRRVQAPRRCWQHKGMSAIRPQEKLLIKDLAH